MNTFINDIVTIGKNLAKEYGADDAVSIKKNKGYTSINFFNQVFARVYETKNAHFISIKNTYISDLGLLPDEFEFQASNPDWGKTLLDSSFERLILSNTEKIFFHCYSMLSENQFGCCSRFTECSDNKKCIHKDKLFAQGCLYRINLENNRIFYGKNRNVEHS